MLTVQKTVIVAGISALLVVAGAAQEHAVKMASLPGPVQATVKEQIAQGATVRNLVTDRENGKLEYEAELTVNGKHRDLTMDASGKVLEAEDAVAIAEVPAPARAAFDKAGKTVSVEAVSQDGKLVAYEAVVRKSNGKRTEVRVTPEGKPAPEN